MNKHNGKGQLDSRLSFSNLRTSKRSFLAISENSAYIDKNNSNILSNYNNSEYQDSIGIYLRSYDDINNMNAHDYISTIGTDGEDVIAGKSGEDFEDDIFKGGAGNDIITGYRGADSLLGGDGNDVIRAGNGRDTISGGGGVDALFGGFGSNIFNNENDGSIDHIYLKSDHLAYNWIYDKAGNNSRGQKADKITKLDSIDKIYIQGASKSDLTFGSVSHNNHFGEEWNGIGIYAKGVLEAVYVDSNLNVGQIMNMTYGADA